MEYNEDYQKLCSNLYNKLMKNYVRYAKYQKKPRPIDKQFNEHHLRVFATNSIEGRTLFNVSDVLYERVINSAIYYLTMLGDKDSDEYIEYKKSINKKSNSVFNLKKLEKKIEEGTYMTVLEANRKIARDKSERSYKKLVDAYETCEKAKIKPQIVKLMEISGLSRATVIKYKKQYLASLNSASNININVNRVIKKKDK